MTGEAEPQVLESQDDLTTAETADCNCPDACERDHDNE